jgi:hypothetical protein
VVVMVVIQIQMEPLDHVVQVVAEEAELEFPFVAVPVLITLFLVVAVVVLAYMEKVQMVVQEHFHHLA